MKNKIIINSISLLSPLTGIGRYTFEISNILKSKKLYEVEFFYGYFSKNLINPSMKSELKNIKKIVIKNHRIKNFTRNIIYFFTKIFSKNYDLYWEPNFIPISGIKAKKIITSIHDFSFILYKDFHPKERINYFEKYFFKNIKKSDYIITGSEFTKQEILQRLDFINEDKIKVIYHGINHNLFKIYDDIKVDTKLPKKFILCVGSIEPRKNLIGLLKAYDRLEENLKNEYKLLLVGFEGWENKKIKTLIEKNKKNISYLGFISDKYLVKVYNLATLFVFPSFYEGFGLPIVEAMACGTPVVCSNTSSLPEIGGDAVVYCNPNSIDDIRKKIQIVLKNKNLQKYLIKKGLKRAKEFTWEKSANEHIKIFKKVLNS